MQFIPRFLVLFIALSCTHLSAAGSWSVKNQNNQMVAVTPSQGFQFMFLGKSQNQQWGTLIIPVSKEQIPALHQHRKTPHFPFIDVHMDVDGYTRIMQGQIQDADLHVRVELDQREWEQIKEGVMLNIELPDGSHYKETLRGSERSLRAIER